MATIMGQCDEHKETLPFFRSVISGALGCHAAIRTGMGTCRASMASARDWAPACRLRADGDLCSMLRWTDSPHCGAGGCDFHPLIVVHVLDLDLHANHRVRAKRIRLTPHDLEAMRGGAPCEVA